MKLRVIAGQYGGRIIDAPSGFTTHPMGERMRGALFNILRDIEGKTVLDAFAGSGAVALEAASRGAARVVAVERDRIAQKVVAKNIESLGAHAIVKLIRANVSVWSDTSTAEMFDIIICDPPYNALQLSTIAKLTRHLKSGGHMILSHPGRESAPTVNGVVVVDNRKYGDAALAIYRAEVQP